MAFRKIVFDLVNADSGQLTGKRAPGKDGHVRPIREGRIMASANSAAILGYGRYFKIDLGHGKSGKSEIETTSPTKPGRLKPVAAFHAQ